MNRQLTEAEPQELATRVTDWLNSPAGRREMETALSAVEADIAKQAALERSRINRRDAKLHPFDRRFNC